jgi:hypothetical protein
MPATPPVSSSATRRANERGSNRDSGPAFVPADRRTLWSPLGRCGRRGDWGKFPIPGGGWGESPLPEGALLVFPERLPLVW